MANALLGRLQDLFRQPPTYDLSPEDKDIIWRYRFSLHTFKRSLTKFLRSVTWQDPAEARQAVEVLLPLWSEVGMDDALELLGPGFEDGRVRAFAVGQLARADDEVCRPLPMRANAELLDHL